ncbi:hypothetical protein BDP81DRAFT_312793 [Colletotrichum phormii]|uniref:Rhodopsin domain-containing protein n=1 Tax=Colletotrichum phormii TaxID=359342 RepID=A0AAI9ZWT0_9PEZI|nr:uncharacterized protein BDP81DRAFT_312793 [Colletotrichum phormii]KAK1639321.1 hypothetical protein BDP81DRAFT_312793 [Colletotrichum phormii]
MALHAVSFPTLPIVKAHLLVNCVLVFFAVIVVALRFFACFSSGAKLWWDDLLILLAVPQGIEMLVIQGLWSPMGIGYPITDTLPNIVIILKLLVVYEFIFATCISTIKLSVMFFYLRVFVNPGLRTATKFAMGFVMVWTTANILQVFLICHPFEATYNPAVPGKCGNQIASFIVIGAFNVITNVMILALPISTVWALKMSTPAKLGIIAVFSIGLIVVAIIRIVSLTNLDLQNLTETMIWASFWSTVEPNMGIICVSMPMLGSLYSRCTGRRDASKLDGPSDASGYNDSNKFRRSQQSAPDTIALETIYSPDNDEHYRSEVASFGREGKNEDSGDDFESRLTPEQELLGRDKVIQAETQWTVSRQAA